MRASASPVWFSYPTTVFNDVVPAGTFVMTRVSTGAAVAGCPAWLGSVTCAYTRSDRDDAVVGGTVVVIVASLRPTYDSVTTPVNLLTATNAPESVCTLPD